MARRAGRLSSDIAGGMIIGQQITNVYINGLIPAALGDPVERHGSGRHKRAVMVSASGNVIANNCMVARQGDSASCGHSLVSGSPDTFIN